MPRPKFRLKTLDEHRFATRFEPKPVTHATWHVALAKALRELSGSDRIQHVEALYLLLEIADLRPRGCDLSKVWLNVGSVYLLFSHLDEAATAYQQSLHLNPTSWRARFNLGVTLARQRVFALAKTELKRGLESCPPETAEQISKLLRAIETVQTKRNEQAYKATHHARVFTMRYLETLHLLTTQPHRAVSAISDSISRLPSPTAPLLFDVKRSHAALKNLPRLHDHTTVMVQTLNAPFGEGATGNPDRATKPPRMSVIEEQQLAREILVVVDDIVEAVVVAVRRERYGSLTPQSDEIPIRTENRHRLD